MSRREKLDYSQMTIEQLREIATPLYNPEELVANLIINNPATKVHMIPGIINHVQYNGYLYCIYVMPDGKPVGVVEIRDAKVYGICVLPEW